MPRTVCSEDFAIGERIRLARLKAGRSQAELARHLGVSSQQVQKYERGRNRVGAVTLIRTATFLQADAIHLLFGSNSPPSAEGKAAA